MFNLLEVSSCLLLSESFVKEGAHLVNTMSCPHSLSLEAILQVDSATARLMAS